MTACGRAMLAPIVSGAFPGHPVLQIQACHRSFIRFMFPLPHCLKTKLPLHRTSPVQGQINKSVVPPCLPCLLYNHGHSVGEPTFPRLCNGAARQRILRAMPAFPRALPRTIMQTRSVSPSQHRGTLCNCAVCALLSLHWFKSIYTTHGRVCQHPISNFIRILRFPATPCCFYPAQTVFCTCSATGCR